MAKHGQPWFVYMIECTNDKIYTGITTDLAWRFAAHAAGKGAKFTKANPPKHFIGAIKCEGWSEAARLELKVKRLTKVRKQTLAMQWPIKALGKK